MNIVFDKKTLQVVSLLDNDVIDNDQAILKCMFPGTFQNLCLWNIKDQIRQTPIGLTVKMDDDRNPQSLIFHGRTIYTITSEDKEKNLIKIAREKEKALERFIPRNLRSSLGHEMLKFWMSSSHTSPYILDSLRNMKYFVDEKIIPVAWGGPFTDAGGYANMNREMIFRMHNYHVLVKAEIWPTAMQVSPTTNYYLAKYNHLNFRRLGGKYTKIHGFTPHPVSAHNGRTVFFTMMETETLHPEFVRVCNKHSDEIWVPSHHNRRVFMESGVNKPIYVMPLGIDVSLYESKKSEIGVIKDTNCFTNLLGRPFSDGVNRFRFLSLFGWSYRKGVDILIKSFVGEFNDDDDVALIICSRHAGSPSPLHQNIIQDETLRYAREVRRDKYPQILLYPHVVPESQMPSIYQMGHVFVHFSRGEGFSLPQIEASVSGLPVISCNNTGMSEYLTDENAFLVKTKEKEICSPEMHWISMFYHHQLFPKLGDEQIVQARKHMRYVLENYNSALAKGKILRQLVLSNYTWDISSERVAKRIKQISNGI